MSLGDTSGSGWGAQMLIAEVPVSASNPGTVDESWVLIWQWMLCILAALMVLACVVAAVSAHKHESADEKIETGTEEMSEVSSFMEARRQAPLGSKNSRFLPASHKPLSRHSESDRRSSRGQTNSP
jgi:hypothetical protein